MGWSGKRVRTGRSIEGRVPGWNDQWGSIWRTRARRHDVAIRRLHETAIVITAKGCAIAFPRSFGILSARVLSARIRVSSIVGI